MQALKKHSVLMAEAGGDGGGGGAAAPAAAPAAPAAAPAGAPAAPAPPAGSSLLAAGGAAPPLAERIPEKYRVMGADGKLDIEASFTKVEEARGHLEKRLGAGDVPPAAIGDYKVTVPDALKESLASWDMAKDDKLQAFLGDAHKAGLTQAQLDVVMGRYFDLAPQLQAAAQVLTPEQRQAKGAEELKQVWKTEADFKAGTREAFKAFSQFGAKAGITLQQIEESGLADNPLFVRLWAAVGPELNEDTTPITDGSPAAGDWQEQVTALKAERDALQPKDPRRAQLQTKINDLYTKRYGSGPAD